MGCNDANVGCGIGVRPMAAWLPGCLAAWLPGCASLDVRVGSGRQGNVASTTTQVQLATDSVVGAAIIVALLFANEVRYFLQSPDGRGHPGVGGGRGTGSARATACATAGLHPSHRYFGW